MPAYPTYIAEGRRKAEETKPSTTESWEALRKGAHHVITLRILIFNHMGEKFRS